MSVLETVTGRRLDLAAPRAEDFALEDVVHGLALTCRFGGQTPAFYLPPTAARDALVQRMAVLGHA